MADDLFGVRPRRKRRVMMHVIDAGNDGCIDVIHFKCSKCGYDDDWTPFTTTVSESKKGKPCPKCNAT